MNLRALSPYDIDPDRGFLPPVDPLLRLPEPFAPWEEVAGQVGGLLSAGKLRDAVAAMPPVDSAALQPGPELERAMLILSALGNAYVWATAEPAVRLPAALAGPLWAVAQRLGRPPIITHASMVLNNWRRLDSAKPIALDNIDTLQLFLGGLDERWFYLVTVAIEMDGAPAIRALAQATDPVIDADPDRLRGYLDTMRLALDRMLGTLQRMPEQCDPYIFYHRVRPYLSSWPAEGVIYEGVDERPRVYSGGSAAQSSLIQALDAGLGVRQTSPFLREMRAYMPPRHRRFVADLERLPSVRDRITANGWDQPALLDAYNDTIMLLDRFRRIHLEYSVRYIKQQAPPESAATGTGGTDFVPLLTGARKATRDAVLTTRPELDR